MATADPWLAARMHNRAQVAAGERDLAPAVRAAVEAYLMEVRTGLGIEGALTAAAAPPGGQGPDWSGWPDDSRWRRLVDRHVIPVWRRVWHGAYRRTAPQAPAGAGAARADEEAAGLAERLRSFPQQVWDRMRRGQRDGTARGETPAALAARVAALATLEEWDGAALTMTRTEVQTALNAGAFAAALDEQTRTRTSWVKTWLATDDARTRSSHAGASGQTVPLHQPYEIGGAALQFPGDPTAPARERFNCRCAAEYARAPE